MTHRLALFLAAVALAFGWTVGFLLGYIVAPPQPMPWAEYEKIRRELMEKGQWASSQE